MKLLIEQEIGQNLNDEIATEVLHNLQKSSIEFESKQNVPQALHQYF